ncbi:Calcium binding and coiled-coil domain-like [Trinorchestia longiramus]|nr:Calcium binding and coiled-coil domain-like [Trinorchestia longiramus]
MDEADDLDVESVSSDYSVLPDAHESEAVARPYLAANAEAGSISSHNQVEFVNMCSSYPSNQDVAIYYSFTGDYMPSVTDRIALYKVGFTTPQDYLVYEWAPIAPQTTSPTSDDTSKKIYGVAFSKSGLPGDASEFYQVCYLREDHLISGVSAPFQLVQEGQSLTSLSSDAVSTVEQADGSVLVTTDLSSLHTNINMLQECVQRVQAEKVTVEEQLASVLLQLQGKAEQLQHLELKLQELNVSAEKQQHASAAALAETESRLSRLQQERDALQDSLQAAQDEVDRLQEKASLQQEQQLRLESQLAQRDQLLQDRETELINKVDELSAAVNQLQALEAKQELLCKEMEECQDDRDRAQQALSDYTDAAAKDHSHLNVLERELSLVNEELRQQMDKLQEEKIALEKSKEELQLNKEELDRERNTLTVAHSSLEACRADLHVALERQKVLDADNRVLQSTVRSHLQHTMQLKENLRESESKCAGAERVAAQLSEAHQLAVRRRSMVERRNKLLATKCQQLSKLILDQNVAESVEALVNFYDDENNEVDDENLPNDDEMTGDREIPPTVTCATVGDTTTVVNSDLVTDAEFVEDSESKSELLPVRHKNDAQGARPKDCQKPLAPVSVELQTVIVPNEDSNVAACSKPAKVKTSVDDDTTALNASSDQQVQVKDKLETHPVANQETKGVTAASSSTESWAEQSETSTKSQHLLTLKTLKTAAVRAKQNWEDLQRQHDEFVSEIEDFTDVRDEKQLSTSEKIPLPTSLALDANETCSVSEKVGERAAA